MAINRFDGKWYDFPGAATEGTGFAFYSVCQSDAVQTRPVDSVDGVIPVDEMNFAATTERAPHSGESAGSLIPIGQCQAEFGADDGEEGTGCRGHCFQTTGTRGSESMRGQYLQVEFATPRNITGIGIRGIGSGPMYGFVWQMSMTHSLDNVTCVIVLPICACASSLRILTAHFLSGLNESMERASLHWRIADCNIIQRIVARQFRG